MDKKKKSNNGGLNRERILGVFKSEKKTKDSTPLFTGKEPEMLGKQIIGIIPGGNHAAGMIKKEWNNMFTPKSKRGEDTFMKDLTYLPVAFGKDVVERIKDTPGFLFGSIATPALSITDAFGYQDEQDFGPLGKQKSFQKQRKDLKKMGMGEVFADALPAVQWMGSVAAGKKSIDKSIKFNKNVIKPAMKAYEKMTPTERQGGFMGLFEDDKPMTKIEEIVRQAKAPLLPTGRNTKVMAPLVKEANKYPSFYEFNKALLDGHKLNSAKELAKQNGFNDLGDFYTKAVRGRNMPTEFMGREEEFGFSKNKLNPDNIDDFMKKPKDYSHLFSKNTDPILERSLRKTTIEYAIASKDKMTARALLKTLPAKDPSRYQLELITKEVFSDTAKPKIVYRAYDGAADKPGAIGQSDLGNGTYFAFDKKNVARYGKNVVEYKLDPKANLLDLSDPKSLTSFTDAVMNNSQERFFELSQKVGESKALGALITEKAKALGFDGVMGDDKAFGTVVFDKKLLTPNSKLNYTPINIDAMKMKTATKGKSFGAIQQAIQNPDLTLYEKAFNKSDVKTLTELGKKHTGDARFQVHKSIFKNAVEKSNPVDPAKHSVYSNIKDTLMEDRTKTKPFNINRDVNFGKNNLQIKGNKIKVFRFTNKEDLLPGDFVSPFENVAKKFAETGPKNGKIISDYVPMKELGTTFNGYQVYKPIKK